MTNLSWLELTAEYQKTISRLEKELTPHIQTADLYSPIPSTEEISLHLKNQRIRSYLNNCRQAQKEIGLRRGEKVKEVWLQSLSKNEREVFVRYYQEQKNFYVISEELHIPILQVEQIVNRSMKKILKAVKDFKETEGE